MTCFGSHRKEVIELGFKPRSEDKLWALPILFPVTYKVTLWNSAFCSFQAKKKFFDTELENLERQQKQQVEKMEQDHAVRRREEAKRIRLEQERGYTRFQEQLKLMKKEVVCAGQRQGGIGLLEPSWLQAIQAIVTSAQPCFSDREFEGVRFPEKLASGMSGSTCSSRTIRSHSPIPWALLSCGLGSQAGPRPVVRQLPIHPPALKPPAERKQGRRKDGGPASEMLSPEGAVGAGGQTHTSSMPDPLFLQNSSL